MVQQFQKKTEEQTNLKRKCNDARFRLEVGRRNVNENRDTQLAKAFRTGVLAQECEAAEAEYSTRKLEGTARSLVREYQCICAEDVD